MSANKHMAQGRTQKAKNHIQKIRKSTFFSDSELHGEFLAFLAHYDDMTQVINAGKEVVSEEHKSDIDQIKNKFKDKITSNEFDNLLQSPSGFGFFTPSFYNAPDVKIEPDKQLDNRFTLSFSDKSEEKEGVRIEIIFEVTNEGEIQFNDKTYSEKLEKFRERYPMAYPLICEILQIKPGPLLSHLSQ